MGDPTGAPPIPPGLTRPELHPGAAELLGYFDGANLRGPQAEVCAEYRTLAYRLVNRGDLSGPELTNALRKLLESKDCAVRASLPRRGQSTPGPGA